MAEPADPRKVDLQRARWRIANARKTGRDPNPEDLEIVENLSKELQLTTPPITPQSPHPQVQRLLSQTSVASQAQQSQESQSSTGDHSFSGPTTNEGTSGPKVDKREMSLKERKLYSFYDKRFGPLIVLILWIVMQDMDKAAFYAPSPKEMRDAAPHFARITAKVEDWLKIPEGVNDVFMISDDAIAFSMIAAVYLDRIGAMKRIADWFVGLMSGGRLESKVEEPSDKQTRGYTGTVRPEPANGQYTGPIDINSVVGLGGQHAAD